MPYRRIPALLAVLALAARANAQLPAVQKSMSATRLVGQVATSSTTAAADATVELIRAQAVVRSARTRADGRFEFENLIAGDYRVRVSRPGAPAQEQIVHLAGPADTVRFQLRNVGALGDSLATQLSARPAAVASPRHWDCRVTDHEVHNAAILAYNRFLGGDAPTMLDSAHAFGIPFTREGFFSDFRRVSDTRECHRIASAIDKQFSLVDQNLRVFRVGKIYFFPDFGDGGMVVGLDGKVLAIYISQS